MFVNWGTSVQLETGGYLPLQPVLEVREAVAENVLEVDELEKELPARERGKERVQRWREQGEYAHPHSSEGVYREEGHQLPHPNQLANPLGCRWPTSHGGRSGRNPDLRDDCVADCGLPQVR